MHENGELTDYFNQAGVTAEWLFNNRFHRLSWVKLNN
jgi:hypothetical protein